MTNIKHIKNIKYPQNLWYTPVVWEEILRASQRVAETLNNREAMTLHSYILCLVPWVHGYVKQKNSEAWKCEEGTDYTMPYMGTWTLPAALLLSGCDELTGQVDWLSHSLPLWTFPGFSFALCSCSIGSMLLMVLQLWQVIRFLQQWGNDQTPAFIIRKVWLSWKQRFWY